MSRIQAAFNALQGKKALIPYVTAGDPNLNTTLDIMHSMVKNGADVIELGVPFSDPMADGPVIQRAAERALVHNVCLKDILNLVAEFRVTNADTPIVLMGYLNPILAMGYQEFASAAQKAGVDGVLTVDCPSEEIEDLHQALKKENVDCIFLISPSTPTERIEQISARASGFLYYVSLKGVTGSASLDIAQVARKIAHLREHTNLPIGVGFGIKDSKTAAAIAQVADAVVVGSRIVEAIEASPNNEAKVAGELVAEFKAAIINGCY